LYAITSLALYTHILAVLVVPVQALWLALGPIQRAGWRRWAPVGVYLTALILPYLPLARWQVPYWTAAAQNDRPMASLPGLLGVLGASFGRGVLPVRSPWQLLPAFLAFLSGVLLWSDAGVTAPVIQPSGRRVVILLLIWLVLPVLLILPISYGLPVLAERYLIWITPAFLMLVGLGVASLGRIWRPLGAALFAAILAWSYRRCSNPGDDDPFPQRRASERFSRRGYPLTRFRIPGTAPTRWPQRSSNPRLRARG
jgi:hypothetical protein